MRVPFATTLALALVAGGCVVAPPPHRCAGPQSCIDFISSSGAFSETGLCGELGWSYSTSESCPSGGRVGRCTEIGPFYALRTSYYSPTTVSDARALCPPAVPNPELTYEFQEN